ncbi:hypothetical protein [Corynebacterium mastitidis]|uniref:hypothetical protein n=1 Tax=Corynebacterium mastitidis TaxID=161890 RepID=UPI00254D4BA7|nr:hypothetical protein [Corynebacterium mastitidis]MDK8450545.1 hypothetical protein [Corynebacterium mastitidis]
MDTALLRRGPVRRTKRRAYILAVWAGWGGVHHHFLGRHARGLVYYPLIFLVLQSAFGWRDPLLAAASVGLLIAANLWGIYRIARSDPDAQVYRTSTGPGFYRWWAWWVVNPLWGWNYWRVPVRVPEKGKPARSLKGGAGERGRGAG